MSSAVFSRLALPSYSVTRAVVSVAVAACTLVPAANAAVPAQPSSDVIADSQPSASLFRVDSALVAPLENVQYRTEGVSSSSVDDERMNLSPEGIAGEGAGQPANGRRRSYGHSRYQDRLHNADGSSKIAFVAGGAIAIPVGSTGKYYTPSYAFQAGAGWNFNKMFGVLGEFHYDHFGLTGGNITNQLNTYIAEGNTAASLQGLDANAHVISLTVNPIVNFSSGRNSKLGAYVTGGVGYYRKSTNFTLPVLTQDYFGNVYQQNVNAITYSANSFGASLGVGLTYKLSEFSSERLFAEGRYDWLKINSANNPDDYIYNRRNTGYIPVEVGIRF